MFVPFCWRSHLQILDHHSQCWWVFLWTFQLEYVLALEYTLLVVVCWSGIYVKQDCSQNWIATMGMDLLSFSILCTTKEWYMATVPNHMVIIININICKINKCFGKDWLKHTSIGSFFRSWEFLPHFWLKLDINNGTFHLFSIILFIFTNKNTLF